MTNLPQPPQYDNAKYNSSPAGYPAYATELVTKSEKEQLDNIKQADKNNSYLGTKIGAGFIFALISLILPIGLFVLPNLLENFLSEQAQKQYSSVILFCYLTFCVIFWAGSIVRCVWDMVKYHSASSSFGLFILLVTPYVWVCIGYFSVALLFSKIVESLGVPGLLG